ncbi:MAG: hypothetical protein DVB22_001612 [Verrucomicrobia bacterium]|nr:MAG: hypothetical protein DVB22_001612 [Verrucomicrobiota bacterium]
MGLFFGWQGNGWLERRGMAGEWVAGECGGRAGAMDGGGVRGAEAECEPAGSPGNWPSCFGTASDRLAKSAGRWQ